MFIPSSVLLVVHSKQIWDSRFIPKVREPWQYKLNNSFYLTDGRPLMMMDTAVVENHGIVPGDIPASHMGLRLPALLSP